jgi:hypothetical protein
MTKLLIGGVEFEVPQGFTPVKWDEVSDGDEVYTIGRFLGAPHAYGPVKVYRKEQRVLEARGRTYSEFPESLLKRDEEYENVFFAQGNEADEYLRRIDQVGPGNVLKELAKDFHRPGEHDVSHTTWRGGEDQVCIVDRYILAWNAKFQTVGLEFRAAARVRKL